MSRPILSKARAALGRRKAKREAIRQLRQGQRPQSGLPDPTTPAAQAITQTTRILSHQMKPRAALYVALLQHAHLASTEELQIIDARSKNLAQNMLDDEYAEAAQHLQSLPQIPPRKPSDYPIKTRLLDYKDRDDD